MKYFKNTFQFFKTRKFIIKILFVILVLFIIFIVVSSSFVSQKYVASRPADVGCEWKKFKGNEVEFMYEDCVKNSRGIAVVKFKQNGDIISMIYDDGSGVLRVDPQMEVYKKLPIETIEQAILRVAGQDFDLYQKTHCTVLPLTDLNKKLGFDYFKFIDPSKIGYEVFPDDIYEKKIALETLKGDIPDPGCGDMGFYADNVKYFEFHPKENLSTFLFLTGRQDTPFFDEQSIHIIN